MTPLTRIQHRSLYGRSKRNRNAVAHLQAFERRAEALMSETAQLKALMSRDVRSAYSDPRYERGTSVNATEVRGSRRWTASKHETGDALAYRAPLWLIEAVMSRLIDASVLDSYRAQGTIVAAGTETAPKATTRKRRSKTAGRAALRAARLRDAAGTIRMGEQD